MIGYCDWFRLTEGNSIDSPQMEIREVISPLTRYFMTGVLTFLMLQCFNTNPHAVIKPNSKIISLLLQKCRFVTVINYNANIWYERYMIHEHQGAMTHRFRSFHCATMSHD